MGAFFVYILKSSVCLAVFYLFYRLLLSRETFHRFNRIGLLGILLLSCAIPLAEVTVKDPVEVAQQFLTLEEMMLMSELGTGNALPADTHLPGLAWREIFLLIYLAGIVFFFFRNMWSLVRMLRLIRGSRMTKQGNGITLITHNRSIAPFSWMKFVVISEKDLEENGAEILAHECAHIGKHHSLDLLVADICIFFQWFNPASWLLKQELQNIHEYEADECVINQGIDAKKYQLLLIKKAVGTRLYSMANSFNHSSLKKRITMMLKEKSSPWARLKYLYMLPVAAIAVTAFARPEVSKELDEISEVKVNDLASIVKTEEVKSAEIVPAKMIKVQGRVSNKADNSPIIGANILVKGTTTGTISDADGKFVITLPEGGSLMCSLIGYAGSEVKVPDSAKQLDIFLEKDVRKVPKKEIAVQKKEVETPESAGLVVKGYGTAEQSKISPLFEVVEEMPEFPGGFNECLKFLSHHIKYPTEAQRQGAQGKVIVQFAVEKDGSISSASVIRPVDPYLDAEAIRVIGLMPAWKPGKQRGESVRVKFTVPVIFKLAEERVEKDSISNVYLSMNQI